MEVLLLVGIQMSGGAGFGDVLLAPRAQFLHGQARIVPVVAIQLFHLLGREQIVLLVVHVEEVRLGVRTSHPDGVQPDVPGHLGGIEVLHELVPHILGQLRPGQSRHVLNASRARLGKSVHLQEAAVGLVDEEDQEEGEESAKDANVRLLEELGRLGDVVDDIRKNSDADVDAEGEPDEEVGGDFLEAGPRPEEEDAPEGQLGLTIEWERARDVSMGRDECM